MLPNMWQGRAAAFKSLSVCGFIRREDIFESYEQPAMPSRPAICLLYAGLQTYASGVLAPLDLEICDPTWERLTRWVDLSAFIKPIRHELAPRAV